MDRVGSNNVEMQGLDPWTLEHVELEERGNLPRLSVVYFVLWRTKVIYIGQTKDLLIRWGSHHQFLEIGRLKGSVRIAWFPVDQTDLRQVEAYFIRRFEPPLNCQGYTRKLEWYPEFDNCLYDSVPFERRYKAVETLKGMIFKLY